eukprot:Rmarinus@m.7357
MAARKPSVSVGSTEDPQDQRLPPGSGGRMRQSSVSRARRRSGSGLGGSAESLTRPRSGSRGARTPLGSHTFSPIDPNIKMTRFDVEKEAFRRASELITQYVLAGDIPKQQEVMLHGYEQQAKHGDLRKGLRRRMSGFFNADEKVKQEAWQQRAGMDREEARRSYNALAELITGIDFVREVEVDYGLEGEVEGPSLREIFLAWSLLSLRSAKENSPSPAHFVRGSTPQSPTPVRPAPKPTVDAMVSPMKPEFGTAVDVSHVNVGHTPSVGRRTPTKRLSAGSHSRSVSLSPSRSPVLSTSQPSPSPSHSLPRAHSHSFAGSPDARKRQSFIRGPCGIVLTERGAVSSSPSSPLPFSHASPPPYHITRSPSTTLHGPSSRATPSPTLDHAVPTEANLAEGRRILRTPPITSPCAVTGSRPRSPASSVRTRSAPTTPLQDALLHSRSPANIQASGSPPMPLNSADGTGGELSVPGRSDDVEWQALDEVMSEGTSFCRRSGFSEEMADEMAALDARALVSERLPQFEAKAGLILKASEKAAAYNFKSGKSWEPMSPSNDLSTIRTAPPVTHSPTQQAAPLPSSPPRLGVTPPEAAAPVASWQSPSSPAAIVDSVSRVKRLPALPLGSLAARQGQPAQPSQGFTFADSESDGGLPTHRSALSARSARSAFSPTHSPRSPRVVTSDAAAHSQTPPQLRRMPADRSPSPPASQPGGLEAELSVPLYTVQENVHLHSPQSASNPATPLRLGTVPSSAASHTTTETPNYTQASSLTHTPAQMSDTPHTRMSPLTPAGPTLLRTQTPSSAGVANTNGAGSLDSGTPAARTREQPSRDRVASGAESSGTDKRRSIVEWLFRRKTDSVSATPDDVMGDDDEEEADPGAALQEMGGLRSIFGDLLQSASDRVSDDAAAERERLARQRVLQERKRLEDAAEKIYNQRCRFLLYRAASGLIRNWTTATQNARKSNLHSHRRVRRFLLQSLRTWRTAVKLRGRQRVVARALQQSVEHRRSIQVLRLLHLNASECARARKVRSEENNMRAKLGDRVRTAFLRSDSWMIRSTFMRWARVAALSSRDRMAGTVHDLQRQAQESDRLARDAVLRMEEAVDEEREEWLRASDSFKASWRDLEAKLLTAESRHAQEIQKERYAVSLKARRLYRQRTVQRRVIQLWYSECMHTRQMDGLATWMSQHWAHLTRASVVAAWRRVVREKKWTRRKARRLFYFRFRVLLRRWRDYAVHPLVLAVRRELGEVSKIAESEREGFLAQAAEQEHQLQYLSHAVSSEKRGRRRACVLATHRACERAMISCAFGAWRSYVFSRMHRAIQTLQKNLLSEREKSTKEVEGLESELLRRGHLAQGRVGRLLSMVMARAELQRRLRSLQRAFSAWFYASSYSRAVRRRMALFVCRRDFLVLSKAFYALAGFTFGSHVLPYAARRKRFLSARAGADTQPRRATGMSDPEGVAMTPSREGTRRRMLAGAMRTRAVAAVGAVPGTFDPTRSPMTPRRPRVGDVADADDSEKEVVHRSGRGVLARALDRVERQRVETKSLRHAEGLQRRHCRAMLMAWAHYVARARSERFRESLVEADAAAMDAARQCEVTSEELAQARAQIEADHTMFAQKARDLARHWEELETELETLRLERAREGEAFGQRVEETEAVWAQRLREREETWEADMQAAKEAATQEEALQLSRLCSWYVHSAGRWHRMRLLRLGFLAWVRFTHHRIAYLTKLDRLIQRRKTNLLLKSLRILKERRSRKVNRRKSLARAESCLSRRRTLRALQHWHAHVCNEEESRRAVESRAGEAAAAATADVVLALGVLQTALGKTLKSAASKGDGIAEQVLEQVSADGRRRGVFESLRQGATRKEMEELSGSLGSVLTDYVNLQASKMVAIQSELEDTKAQISGLRSQLESEREECRKVMRSIGMPNFMFGRSRKNAASTAPTEGNATGKVRD